MKNRIELEWVNCELCESHIAVQHLGIQRLVKCTECGLIFVNPRPKSSMILEQYNQDYFSSENPVSGGYEDYLADEDEICRTFNKRIEKLNTIFDKNKSPNLLEIGSAAGFFLEVAKRYGIQGQGIELCKELAAVGRKRGQKITISSIEDAKIPDASVDIVVLWDVIEHLNEPKEALIKLNRWLKPGGYLIMTTPDAGSFLARLLRKNWLGFRSLDEHLYFFSRKTMREILVSSGFKEINIMYAGKYLSIGRIITRLRYYTRIGALLLQFFNAKYLKGSLYLNPFDTILVVAEK